MAWKSVLVEEDSKEAWQASLGNQKMVHRASWLLDLDSTGRLDLLKELGLVDGPYFMELRRVAVNMDLPFNAVFMHRVIEVLDAEVKRAKGEQG